MKALEATDPESMRQSRKYAFRDSIADVYLLHQSYVLEGYLDGGTFTEPSTISRDGDAYKSCSYALDGSEACATFTDFKIKDGKLTDFRVDGKEPGKRLTLGNGEVLEQGNVKVELLTAYKTAQSEALIVTARVGAGDEPVDVELLSFAHRAPNGKQRKTSEGFGPESIDADSNAVVGAVFPGASAGGRVTFKVCIDYCEREQNFTLNLTS